MKTARTIGKVLAWFNLIYWGFSVITSLLQGLASANMSLLVASVLLAAIPLNSYAALQLHRSIRNPEIKLSHQTPVGIRFVGSFVVLMGIFLTGVALLIILGAKELLPAMKENAVDMLQMLNITSVGQLQGMGAIMLFFGAIMIASALINMRLLRWYYLVKQSDVS
jgi:hypothetical protein